MSTRGKKPTDAELAILTVLWERGPSTVREVAEAMGRGGAYTTVMKLLQIMTDTKLVVKAIKNVFLYNFKFLVHFLYFK